MLILCLTTIRIEMRADGCVMLVVSASPSDSLWPGPIWIERRNQQIERERERERGSSYSECSHRNILYTHTHIWTHQQTNSIISVALKAVVRKNLKKWGLFNHYYTFVAYRKGSKENRLLSYMSKDLITDATCTTDHILVNIILHNVCDSLVPGLKLSIFFISI